MLLWFAFSKSLACTVFKIHENLCVCFESPWHFNRAPFLHTCCGKEVLIPSHIYWVLQAEQYVPSMGDIQWWVRTAYFWRRKGLKKKKSVYPNVHNLRHYVLGAIRMVWKRTSREETLTELVLKGSFPRWPLKYMVEGGQDSHKKRQEWKRAYWAQR